MKKTEGIMGMDVAVEILDKNASEHDIDYVFDYFHLIDQTFSTYKKTSEISRINRGKMNIENASSQVKKVLTLCEDTRLITNGYFNIYYNGQIDPSGIVKGYAIYEASKELERRGYKNFYVEIGGDIEVRGLKQSTKWKIGIRNPFNINEIVKVIYLSDCGIATSGTYMRGNHIYDPVKKIKARSIASMTVVGPNVYEADRFATAAFAMGDKGILFIEKKMGLEAYMITSDKKAVMTSGFENYFSL